MVERTRTRGLSQSRILSIQALRPEATITNNRVSGLMGGKWRGGEDVLPLDHQADCLVRWQILYVGKDKSLMGRLWGAVKKEMFVVGLVVWSWKAVSHCWKMKSRWDDPLKLDDAVVEVDCCKMWSKAWLPYHSCDKGITLRVALTKVHFHHTLSVFFLHLRLE